jgi:hypothetical protein
MEKLSKRGKIPPQDWPSIISRYQSGETLASIARTYDCSPPAISYIVSRSRARNAAAEGQGGVPPQEPQLVKSQPEAWPSGGTPPAETAGADSPAAPQETGGPPAIADAPAERPEAATRPGELQLFADAPLAVRREPAATPEDPPGERRMDRPRPTIPIGNGNIARSFGSPATIEPRRMTLHLPLTGGDGSHRHDAPPQPAAASSGERPAAPPPMARPAPDQSARPGLGPYAGAGNGAPMGGASDPRPTKEGGAFIDQALRERVDSDIAAFLAAFDAALAHDTVESRIGLREATQRLLRAGARTQIELERLEARLPLVRREKSGQDIRAFRPR